MPRIRRQRRPIATVIRFVAVAGVLALTIVVARLFFWPSQIPDQLPDDAVAARVDRVVDGDTLVAVDEGGERFTVRFIGVDTPETVAPHTPVQCFGPEASARTHELVDGRRVFLEPDASQGDADRYGRRLAYVWIIDPAGAPLLVNEQLIEGGFATEYTYDSAYRYQAAFRHAQKSARDRGTGLWSPNGCNGKTTNHAASAARG